jgi:hypothetical protein
VTQHHRLDGNALGGTLAGVFAAEATTLELTCGSCGSSWQLGDCHAYLDGPGIVVRCCGCDALLMRVAQLPTGTWVDLRGAASVRMPRGD